QANPASRALDPAVDHKLGFHGRIGLRSSNRRTASRRGRLHAMGSAALHRANTARYGGRGVASEALGELTGLGGLEGKHRDDMRDGPVRGKVDLHFPDEAIASLGNGLDA